MNKKKLLAVLSALAIAFLPALRAESTEYKRVITADAADEHRLGDVNGDGKVDGKDASEVLAVYSQLSSGIPVEVSDGAFYTSDVDADGKMTAKDASHILAYYSYLSTGGTEDISTFIKAKSETSPEVTTAPVTTSPTQTTTASPRTIITPTLAVPSVTLTQSGENEVKITWDKIEGAEAYRIEFSPKSDFSFINSVVTITSTSYTKKELTVGETCYMRIFSLWQDGSDTYVSECAIVDIKLPLEVTTTTTSETTTTTTTTTITTTSTTTTTTAPTTKATTAQTTTAVVTTSTAPVTIVRKMSWTDPNTGKNVSYTLTFNKLEADYYSTIPRIREINRWTEYCSDEQNKALMKEFANWVNKTGDAYGYTNYQKVLLAAQVAQKIPYKTDIESRGVTEYPKYPYETFYDGCGDCEDKSIILAGILHEMNYAVALLHFSNHMAVGISGGSGIYGQYYTLSGSDRRYFYIESTNFGSKIGECPAEYKNEIPKVYLLKFD